ncbi:MAG: hypothetical protein ACM3SY_14475 [Candidatus Omnitrophota bacterium]
MFTAKYVILFLSLFIYVLILFSFNKARKKYSGGKIGEVIKIILITTVLLFASDYTRAFGGFLPENIIFILETSFKILAISFLAYGGSKIAI